MAEEFNFNFNIPVEEELNYNTLITPFESGKEQRRQKWSQPKRIFTLSFNAMAETELDRMWSFYQARAGAYGTFTFENPTDSPISAEASIHTANGSRTTFGFANYPWTSGDVTIYKNGVASGDYTIDYANGQITFGKAPQAGAAITGSYHFGHTVRFMEDKLSRSMFSYKLWASQLKLIQVL